MEVTSGSRVLSNASFSGRHGDVSQADLDRSVQLSRERKWQSEKGSHGIDMERVQLLVITRSVL